eukprot:scaffold23861_cov37-Cyclotella_meneghiniana.AAC.1
MAARAQRFSRLFRVKVENRCKLLPSSNSPLCSMYLCVPYEICRLTSHISPSFSTLYDSTDRTIVR